MSAAERTASDVSLSGRVAIHRSGDVVVLGPRNHADDGWKLAGFRDGGLSDRALAGPDWALVTTADLIELFERVVTS